LFDILFHCYLLRLWTLTRLKKGGTGGAQCGEHRRGAFVAVRNDDALPGGSANLAKSGTAANAANAGKKALTVASGDGNTCADESEKRAGKIAGGGVDAGETAKGESFLCVRVGKA
jgi:hypothetical protein